MWHAFCTVYHLIIAFILLEKNHNTRVIDTRTCSFFDESEIATSAYLFIFNNQGLVVQN